MHEGGERWAGSSKLVELKKKKLFNFHKFMNIPYFSSGFELLSILVREKTFLYLSFELF